MSAVAVARAPIQVLPPRAAERIAAGEVVERPASVVKELVENALDAGAQNIRVEVRGGGLRLVRVVDDGCGIPADEVALAFERHATSKIRGVEDLGRLTTLGFRGEALPSIAAVADVTVLTATDDAGLGCEARVRGGRVVAQAPKPRTRGTTVTAQYLFQSVPARLKFIADARHEVAAIGMLVRRYALAYPTVRFTLLTEGRLALRTSGTGLTATLREVYGPTVAEALRPLPPLEVAGSRWEGYLGERHVTRPHRGGLTLIVNGRWVEVRELLAALEAAYRPLLPRGRHPVGLLRCTIAPADLDVNVHPAKTEVKFLHAAEIARGVATWVRDALGRGAAQPPLDVDLGLTLGDDAPPAAAPAVDAPGQAQEPALRWYRVAEGWPAVRVLREASGTRGAGKLPPFQLLGQVQDALLLGEGPGGLYLVDQHRAHERVLYEHLRARHGPAPEPMVEPIVLELRPAQAARLGARLEALRALGFVCEWFGGRSFLVRAAPRLPEAPGREAADAPARGALAGALDALLTEAAEEGDWQDRLLVSVACRAAVRRGQPLAPATMAALLDALDQTTAPAVCPHGSPLILHISEAFLARQLRWR